MASVAALQAAGNALQQLAQQQRVDSHGNASFLSPSDIHVLVVDDERLSRTVVSSLLRNCSYKVTVVSSGVEALATLRQAQPGTFHLVLTDLVMPEVDGLDLLRYVREDDNLRTVPVVMMSASERRESMVECIKDGAEDYLLKPLRRKEVQFIWQHVWRRQQSALAVPDMGEEQDEFGDSAASTAAHVQMDSVPVNSTSSDAGAFLRAAAMRASGPSATDLATATTSQPAPLRQQAAGLAAPLADGRVALACWLSQRQARAGVQERFALFCRLVSLLKIHHLQGRAHGRLRPSQVMVTPAGALDEAPAGTPVPPNEHSVYAAPEEAAGGPPSPPADVYALGMLFVELFYAGGLPPGQRGALLAGAREARLPPWLLARPDEASFLTSVLRRDPDTRPTLVDIAYSDTLPKLLASLSAAPPAAALAAPGTAAGAPVGDAVAVGTFLRMARERALAEAAAVAAELDVLDEDLGHMRVVVAAARERAGGGHGLPASPSASPSCDACAPLQEQEPPASTSKRGAPAGAGADARAGKRQRTEGGTAARGAASGVLADRLNRITPLLGQLDAVYLQRRLGVGNEPGTSQRVLSQFCEDLSRFARYSSFADRATVKYGELPSLNDMVCSIAYDRDDEYFATAGVSRRLKVFDMRSVLESDSAIHYPVLELNARSKLACVCWNPYVKSNFIVSDYDGTIQLWDASNKTELLTFDEHARRCWSVDFSLTDPTRFLSGSDDHAVKLWALNTEASVATLDAKANVCSVQFHPTNSHLVACGAANYRAYLHDLRNTSAPLAVIGGHSKAVSYVRFLDSGHLMTASTDSKLRLWNLAEVARAGRASEPCCVYRGHTNEKNFVGLSVSPGGYISCGSEDNALYTYSSAMPMPLTSFDFGGGSSAYRGGGGAGLYQHFVSSVCWGRKGRYCAVANSMGVLKVLELQ